MGHRESARGARPGNSRPVPNVEPSVAAKAPGPTGGTGAPFRGKQSGVCTHRGTSGCSRGATTWRRLRGEGAMAGSDGQEGAAASGVREAVWEGCFRLLEGTPRTAGWGCSARSTDTLRRSAPPPSREEERHWSPFVDWRLSPHAPAVGQHARCSRAETRVAARRRALSVWKPCLQQRKWKLLPLRCASMQRKCASMHRRSASMQRKRASMQRRCASVQRRRASMRWRWKFLPMRHIGAQTL